jgi:cytosine/adenosine deaminase-related metal-dependent hydrolase
VCGTVTDPNGAVTGAVVMLTNSETGLTRTTTSNDEGVVARDRRAKKAQGAKSFSGRGMYLIPGLIDSHVHLTLVPGMDVDQVASRPEIVNKYFQQLPRSYLYYGYTTVVYLGVAANHQRLQDFRQAPQHPDLYNAVIGTCTHAANLFHGSGIELRLANGIQIGQMRSVASRLS